MRMSYRTVTRLRPGHLHPEQIIGLEDEVDSLARRFVLDHDQTLTDGPQANIRHVADVRRSVSSHDTGMPARLVLLAVALVIVGSCSAPESATPGVRDALAAPTTRHASTLECPAGPGTASRP
jgi:hypothetical protein